MPFHWFELTWGAVQEKRCGESNQANTQATDRCVTDWIIIGLIGIIVYGIFVVKLDKQKNAKVFLSNFNFLVVWFLICIFVCSSFEKMK